MQRAAAGSENRGGQHRDAGYCDEAWGPGDMVSHTGNCGAPIVALLPVFGRCLLAALGPCQTSSGAASA